MDYTSETSYLVHKRARRPSGRRGRRASISGPAGWPRALADGAAGEEQQRSATLVKAVRRHAKVEEIVINSIQTSFVSERMIEAGALSIEALELTGRAVNLLKKRKIPFHPQLCRTPAN